YWVAKRGFWQTTTRRRGHLLASATAAAACTLLHLGCLQHLGRKWGQISYLLQLIDLCLDRSRFVEVPADIYQASKDPEEHRCGYAYPHEALTLGLHGVADEEVF